jgi:hypothetical protein
MRYKFAFLRIFPFYFNLSATNKLEFVGWFKRNFENPVPHFLKMKVLSAASDVDAWIETGTYVGQTTRFLGESGTTVVSIEPSVDLAVSATRNLSSYTNIKIVNALSEEVLGEVIDSLPHNVKRIAFWLDGHYSEGATHLGPIETPIRKELEIIEGRLQKFADVKIFIDDFRCFVEGYTDYPKTSYLSEWSERNSLNWEVKHDIFIASKN